MHEDFALYLNGLLSQHTHGASRIYDNFGRASGKEFMAKWFKRLADEYVDLVNAVNDENTTAKDVAQALSDLANGKIPTDYLSAYTDNNMKASRSNIDDNQNELEQAWESSILNGIK